MATIIRDKTGKGYDKLSVKVGGKPKRVSLGGKLTARDQSKLLRIVDELEACHAFGRTPDKRTLTDFGTLSEALRDRVAKTGLIESVEVPTLGPFLTKYVSQHAETGITEYTVNKLTRSAGYLTDFFGADREIASITEGDAVDYKAKRQADGKAASTIASEVKHAKQFFRYAVKKGFVHANPFDAVTAGLQASDTMPVEADVLRKVADGLPTAEWRCLFALCRWLGCRRGEALELKWGDILWDEGKIRLPSPKTARYGQDFRLVPLFPELRPYLDALWDETEDGTEYVVSTLVDDTTRRGMSQRNLGKLLVDRVKALGVEPWSGPFKALRVTRENELEQVFPSHVVQSWIGHSRQTAEKHYLKVTEADFGKAAEATADFGLILDSQASEMAGLDRVWTGEEIKTSLIPAISAAFHDLAECQMPPQGLEP